MTRLDDETKQKLREMGSTSLLSAFDAQDDDLTLGMPFEERIRLAVDDAHAAFTHAKVEGLIRRAGLRYPDADLRRIALIDQRGLDRDIIAQLGTASFITRQLNVVFQGFTGSDKSYLGSALAKQACQHRYRAYYIRMPDLEEAWATAQDKPGGREKWLRKYSAFTLLVIDELCNASHNSSYVRLKIMRSPRRLSLACLTKTGDRLRIIGYCYSKSRNQSTRSARCSFP
ncbi:MAG: ATP-binding protein [Brevibacterium sp.]|nr:ATP-binding protein [Brevibacterium sp.]MDN5833235.1 ATP-binding protein [Brevibacterium sp.]MDN5875857.1 ATP-binding protein [Brevibacterium sp.]MDN5908196.1 ATP-binding protein [Brevibacterium sp.]MDN6122249.1 ATP-binding protein [Brevibacterium sp.]MDN6132824.1 ATP-binding protein [Brevibacterium sp.]